MGTDPKPPRAASHYWLIIMFVFMALATLVMWADFLSHRSGASINRYLIFMVRSTVFPIGAFCLVAGGRRKWAYYITTGCLTLLTLWSSYNVLFRYFQLLIGATPHAQPYFNIAERDQPFIVQRETSAIQQLAYPLALIVLVYLAWRFIFGKPSRAYYKFPVSSTNGVAPLPSTSDQK